MEYTVYDPAVGVGYGPFDTHEEAIFFIQYATDKDVPGAEMMEVQELMHPQDFVLDLELEEDMARL